MPVETPNSIAEEKATPAPIRSVLHYFANWWAWAINAAGITLLACWKDWQSLFTGVVAALGLLGCLTLSVILHELGHLFVGRCLGMEFQSLSLGMGDIIFEKQTRLCRLILRKFPLAGAVFPAPGTRNQSRWRVALMIAAGPMVNAVLLAFFASCSARSSAAPSLCFTLMTLANLSLLVISLIPHTGKLNGARVANDGLRLFRLILNKPDTSWLWSVKNVPPKFLLDYYRNELAKTQTTTSARTQLLDGFATATVMYGANECLPEADRYSAELLESKPDEWTVKGTRGSVLVDMGDLEAGMRMLREVMEHDPSKFDRAISACFLAIGEFKQGNRKAAEEWADRARSLDPKCGALPRIDSMLKGGSNPPSRAASPSSGDGKISVS